MDYQNLRGGSIVLNDIQKPPKQQWGNVLEAVEDALELEKDVNKVSKQFRFQDKCFFEYYIYVCVDVIPTTQSLDRNYWIYMLKLLSITTLT